MKKGQIIVIEGACDGIGKTTQFTLLRDHLEKDREKIVSHHFPSYNTYQGAPVEKYLSGECGRPQELSPYFINNLYASDRAITWHTTLKKEYQEGKIIFLDRYTTSSLIYQSCLIDNVQEKKAFLKYVTDFEYNRLGIKEPDNVIFLHAPFELVTELRNVRKENEGILNDIHERDIEYMKKVYENAMFVADYLNCDKVCCNKGNQMRDIKDIHEEIYALVKRIKQ